MNTRQDFTDLKMKADSLAEFLRVLHSASLDKFSDLNQRYFEFKNIMDEPDTSGMKRANLMNKFYEVLVAGGNNELFENSANKITIQINTISLFYSSSIPAIINSAYQILTTERTYLDGLSPNSKEYYVIQDIDRTFSTISQLLVGIQSTLNDGTILYNELISHLDAYLMNYNPSTSDPMYTSIIDWKRSVALWIWNKIQYEVRDHYKMLLGAIVENEAIDKAMIEETDTNVLERLVRRREELPLDSSPGAKGGMLRDEIIRRISYLDTYAKTLFNYFGWIGAGDSLETIVPTSPGMGFASNSIATDYGYAMALNHFGKSTLCSGFNDNSDTDFTSLLPSSTAFIQNYVIVKQYEINMFMARDQIINGYDVATSITSKYRIEKEIEKLDSRRDEVATDRIAITSLIDGYTTELSSDAVLREEAVTQRDVRNQEALTVFDTLTSINGDIESLQSLIAQKEEQLQREIDELNALDPTDPGYEAAAANAQQRVDFTQNQINSYNANLADKNTLKAAQEVIYIDLLNQISTIDSNIAVIDERIAFNNSEISDLTIDRNKLDDWLANYSIKRNELADSAVLDSHWGILDSVNMIGEDIKLYTSNKIDSERAIESITEQVKQVKLTTKLN